MASLIRLVLVCIALAQGAARAASPVEEAQLAELERARAEVASQVQLQAYDLVDELVYGWTQTPPFQTPTPVVLAEVTVPLGLGTGLQGMLENHLSGAVIAHPTTRLTLVHCPACTAVVVHSAAEGTVIGRGIDDPALLSRFGDTAATHALFVDVEAEGSALVLRARLTDLSAERRIVWSRTISTSTGTPALLREPQRLVSAEQARQDYLDVLRSRGPILIPARFTVRSFARPEDFAAVRPPPFIWLQTGIETGTTQARQWTSSLLFGYSFVPQGYQGLLAQARVSRLLTGQARSLTRPDLYLFVGGAVMTVWGPVAASFRDDRLTADEIVTDLQAVQPRATFGGLHLGLDLRVGNRIGLSQFLETIPYLNDSENLGSSLTVLGIRFQTLGTEVTFWF